MARTLVLIALASFALAACSKPITRDQGATSIRATYAGSTLSAVLPDSARVPAVMAAALATAKARGYTIIKESTTEETGLLVVRPPRASDWPQVTIEGDRVPLGSRVRITVSVFGDEALSRSLLDGILERLGM